MDYDENDFQSQNFQLAGDENKFPPSLRPFALPKFDLDEHLQVHLRFDSLVDTDVLLGIHGQDNNWIEDFSSGTSAIEFSSSAADNCSISRRNNVWSEATSSESVEMLLRSVGEDDMKDKKVIVTEADAQNVSIGMIDQMDPASRQVDDDNSLMEDIAQDDLSVPPDKFQRNLLVRGVQPQVQGMSQIFSDELSFAELDASSLGDKFNSNRKIGAGKCTAGDTVALPSDDTNKKSSITSETVCNMVPNNEPLKMEFIKSSDGHGWDASEVARESPDSVTCRSTQEQVAEKHTIINTTEESNLPSDDVQKERSQMLRDANGNEPFLEGNEAETHLYRDSSSFLEPHRDTLVLMSEEYNVTGFSDKPDGLLQAITYQVKTLNNDNKAGDKCSMWANEMNSLETKRERFIETDYVDIRKENMRIHLTDHTDKGIGNTSEIALEANASIQVESETLKEETKYENRSEINNLSSQSPESTSLEKSVETEVTEESGSKLFLSENVTLGESPFPAVPNNHVIKISSFVSGTLHKAAESSDDKSSMEVSAGEAYIEPSTNPHTTNSKSDDHAVIGEAEAAAPAGQNSDDVGVSVPNAKLDGSGPSGLPSSVMDGPCEQKEVSSAKLLEPNSIYSDAKVKITGISSVSILKSNSDSPLPVEPVILSDTVVTDGSPLRRMTQDVRGVQAFVLDETVKFHQSQDASTADMIPEQKEGTSSSQFSSEFFKSNEKEARVYASSSLAKSDSKVDNRPLVESDIGGNIPFIESESDIGENIPFNSTIKPQTALKEQHSSYVESSVVSQTQSELQSLADKSITHEEVTTVGENIPSIESDIGENIPFNSTIKPQTALTEQRSSYVESSVVSQTQSELQSLADKSITHEEVTTVEKNLVNHDSSVKGKDRPDVSEASSHKDEETAFGISAELPSHSEGHMLPEVTPSVENPSAAPVNLCENTSTTLSGSNAEAQLAVDTCKPSLPEASCDSPTVISCSEHSQGDPEGGNVHKAKYTALDSNENTASEGDKNFTYDVGRVEELPEKHTGSQWKPFSSPVQSSELPKISKQTRGSRSESEGKHHSKTAPWNTTRHASRSSNEKPNTPRGRLAKGTSTAAKGTSTCMKSTDSVGKSCTTSSAPVAIVSIGIQLEERRPYTYTESNRVKTSGSPIVQSSSVPDLNSSASATTLFHQPFTDLQQVQLRAQIFVYGSLIQSIPPDEACMQSAFGEADGGRSLWESVWRKSGERYQNQKSPVNSETPLHSHSVVRALEQATKSSSLQSKAVSASASRSTAKVIAPANLNSTPPLPSPLWSISTHDGLHSNLPRGTQLDFNQALSPLHSYPSSQTRQFTSNSTQWLPQNPCPGPWVVSAQSPALNAATQYSTVPVVESVQVTPVRDSLMSHASSTQLATPSPLLPAPSPTSVPPASVLHLEIQRKTASPGNNKNATSNQKSRKRKKAAVTEDAAETISVSQSFIEPASATTVPKTLPSASTALPLSTNTPSKVASEPIDSSTTHISPTQYQTLGSGNTEQRLIFSEETGNKIEQAKLQAEDAAAIAASVVSHSQAIWNQLAAQRNSGLVTEVEEKLSSAAVAAAAAASVANAAAAAAKVASDVALQAKMMADEALDLAKTGSLKQSSEAVSDAEKNLARLTPGSILKGKDKIHGSNSIISAAREATKRRLEAASAATKRAENLDAIMKAAELAAEAVSQVGTIIAMGDPLPFKLSELVEAGPEGSWKAYRPTSEKLNKSNQLPAEEVKDLDVEGDHHEKTPINTREIHNTSVVDGLFRDELTVQSEDNFQGLVSRVGNPSTLPNNSHERDHSLSYAEQNVVQKGSVVEVMSDEEGLRGGWFSARVLDVKDNKAHVCFNNLLSDDGSGQLKEWVSLDSESNGAPRIRIAHLMIATKYDGTRKRQREAVGNYVWTVGDRVDARMRDGWWEGIITEKSQLDETKLTVHFEAGGDSSLVRAWDLRPSLTWKDGQWIEWSRARGNTLQQYEGDTPQEKRQKLSRLEAKLDTEVDDRGIGKLSKKMPAEDLGKPQELRPLNLSAKDTLFSVGKNVNEASVSDALKVKRTGLQKEGSRVVFGVPKPGKKRKFMDVSKHYVSDKTDKTSQGNNSLKFAKYLMPQVSRPWRNTSKVDSKGKRAGDSKPLGVKSVKSQTTQTRSMTEKVNPSLATVSVSTGEKHGQGSSSNIRAGFGKEENNVEKHSVEVVSFPSSLGTTGSLVAASSHQSLPTLPPSKKKSSSTAEADLGVRGKATPVLQKSVRSEKKPSENQVKSTPDAIEPRRSNRRIQPTSRLLEGLQSSLIISKIPTFSHDKGSKALHRSSSSRGHTHG